MQDPRLGDQEAELGPAAAAQGGGQPGDVRPAGPYVHSEPARDGLVHVSLDQQLGDGPLDARDPVGRVRVGDLVVERDGAPPQLLEDLDQVLHEPGVAQLQRHPAVVADRDEGHGPVEDDQPFDQLLQRADLHLARGDPVHVGERALAVPRGVLVQRSYADAAVDQRSVPFQGLGEGQGGPGAARLDGEHLRMTFGRRQIQRRVDPFESFQHGDGVRVRGALRADGEERLESIGEIYSGATTVLDLAFNRMQPLRQCNGWGNRTELVGVIGVGLQEGEFKQAGSLFDLAPRDPAGAERRRIQPRSLGAQGRDGVGMCRVCRTIGQISTPRVLNMQEHDASSLWH